VLFLKVAGARPDCLTPKGRGWSHLIAKNHEQTDLQWRYHKRSPGVLNAQG
jgi:hypothetical protein